MDKETTLEEKLISLMETMDVPPGRIKPLDLAWLSRNLWIRNNKHEKLNEAMDTIAAISRARKGK